MSCSLLIDFTDCYNLISQVASKFDFIFILLFKIDTMYIS